ncbi:MAG: zinc-binding alcohol dehydrogenase [Desulfobacterales bacterium]
MGATGLDASVKRTAVIFDKPFAISVATEAVPEGPPGQVLVETGMSAISPGTELLIYRGRVPAGWPVDSTLSSLSGAFGYPLRYGYAAVGRVVGAGPDADPGLIGHRVFSFQPHQSHFHADPAELIPIPADIDSEDALFVPTMETAVNFMMDGRPMIGERVVVIGQGIVGLLTTALLARFPLSELVAIEPCAFRRQKSLEAGAQKALAPASPQDGGTPDRNQAADALRDPADLVYEVSGDPAALDQAISACGFDGRVIVGSWYGTRRAALNLGQEFHRNRIRLLSSQVSTIAPELTGRWSKQRRMAVVWDMIRTIRPARFITHRFAVEQAAQAYDLLDRQSESAVQVVITYGGSPPREEK